MIIAKRPRRYELQGVRDQHHQNIEEEDLLAVMCVPIGVGAQTKAGKAALYRLRVLGFRP